MVAGCTMHAQPRRLVFILVFQRSLDFGPEWLYDMYDIIYYDVLMCYSVFRPSRGWNQQF